MAPQTRSVTLRESTPPISEPVEADTIKRTRFFDFFDSKIGTQSQRATIEQSGIKYSTARHWLRKRHELGQRAYRRTRSLSEHLGKPFKVKKDTCRTLISPSKNPVRHLPYEAQIEHHKLGVSARTLRRALAREINGAQMYKQAYIQKELSGNNRDKRLQYANQHCEKTVDSFWRYVVFTDETHFDPGSRSQGRVLREKGTRYSPDNIQERGSLVGNKVHFAAWVTWDSKAPELIF